LGIERGHKGAKEAKGFIGGSTRKLSASVLLPSFIRTEDPAMKRKMIDATKATLQEPGKDPYRLELHEARLPSGRCRCGTTKHRTERTAEAPHAGIGDNCP